MIVKHMQGNKLLFIMAALLALLVIPAATAERPDTSLNIYVHTEMVEVIIGDCGVQDDESSGITWGYDYNAPAEVWFSYPNPKSGTGWTESTVTICVHS